MDRLHSLVVVLILAAGVAVGTMGMIWRRQSVALDSAANVIVITDKDGVILWVNPEFTGTSGYSSEEVLGKKPNLLKSGTHAQSYYKSLCFTKRKKPCRYLSIC